MHVMCIYLNQRLEEILPNLRIRAYFNVLSSRPHVDSGWIDPLVATWQQKTN